MVIDIVHVESNSLGRTDDQPLSALDCFDEVRRLEKCFRRVCVEPHDAAPHGHKLQFAHVEVALVEFGYLQLTSCGRRDLGHNLSDAARVDLHAGNSPVRARFSWSFIDFNDVSGGIELDHAACSDGLAT